MAAELKVLLKVLIEIESVQKVCLNFALGGSGWNPAVPLPPYKSHLIARLP